MKTVKLALVLFAFIGAKSFAGTDPHKNVSVLSMKRDIFYFKVCPSLIGGKVDVYSPDGALVASQELTHRKSIIDFYFEKPGHFTIKIIKEGKEIDFDYEKKSPSPFVESAPDYHISIQ